MQIDTLSRHFQCVNLQVWQAGSQLAGDEMMVRFQGRSHYTTCIPKKPEPIGFKIWGIAENGFIIVWVYHQPGLNKGPVNIRCPVELGGTKKAGNRGNRTQAVIWHMLKRLPRTIVRHCFLDNLFVSYKFLAFMRQEGFAITGTTRPQSGVHKKLINIQKSDKKDIVPWGTVDAVTTPCGLVQQIGFKDNAYVLFMSTVYTGKETIVRNRKRPKATSSKAKTARAPFGNQPTKDLSIPVLVNDYNHQIGAVDEVDHLTAQNAGLRLIRRGGAQALEHWLLRVSLTNSYLLSLYSDVPEPRQVKFRSQKDFRQKLIQSLLAQGRTEVPRSNKRRISRVEPEADNMPLTLHTFIKMPKRGWCFYCKGGRVTDRPQKRVALGQIAVQNNRQSAMHQSSYGCKECNISLCRERGCWLKYHNNT